jgi:hypothetical protein
MHLQSTNQMKYRAVKFFVFAAALLAFVELLLRFIFGLGDLPVYVEDAYYEYIYAPNQNVKRFGNRIITNEYSMRSLPLSDTDEIRILKLGDSVINAGSQTTHDSLASTILERELSQYFEKKIRVLNIGANSWGPDNALAYIKAHGHFGASMLVLVFSSHDLYDHMHFQKVVGVHPAWPDKKPLSAITDVTGKYIFPWIKQRFYKNYNPYSYLAASAKSNIVNPGWQGFFNYVRENNLSLLVYLHPATDELQAKDYNLKGKEIIKMLQDNEINYMRGIDYELPEGFRDNIHLNETGQRKLTKALRGPLVDHIKTVINAF